MVEKSCFKCGLVKPLSEFYRHSQMGDGYLGKCKECTKSDAKERYYAFPEKIRAYEHARFKTPQRKAKIKDYVKNYKEKNPEKVKARRKFWYAIRSGKIIKQPCQVCGDPKSEAHHHDYSKPLDVIWYCFKHHRTLGHNQKPRG